MEELFASRGRVKILKLLLREGGMNITRIVKETGLHYNLVIKHLKALEALGLVVQRRFGRSRVFTVNYDNPKVAVVKDLMALLEGES